MNQLDGVTQSAARPDLNGLTVEEIARVLLGEGLGAGPLARNLAELVLTIYRDLALGRPLGPERLARTAGAAGVCIELAKGAGSRWLEFDDAGDLVGFGGLTLRPTAHRLLLGDTPLHLWCALDGLLIVHALCRRVKIETHCPSTGALIEVCAGPLGIEAVVPRSAMMSIVAPPSNCGCSVADTRRGFCDFVNFFGSETVAREAVAGRGGAVLSLEAAFTLAGLLMAPLRSAG